MKTRLARIARKFLSIRALTTFWAFTMFAAWAILVVASFLAKSRLADLGNRVVTEVKALDAARRLELAILAHRRECLLWKASGQDYHRERGEGHLAAAERIADDLDPYLTTQPEHALAAEIRDEMRTLRGQYTSPDSMEVEVQAIYVSRVLEAIERLQEWNDSHVEQSVRAANHLQEVVSYSALGLLVGTAGLLLAGLLAVIRRVIHPALALTGAADAFGQGDLAARAPVLHDDELGALAWTFNNMAHDIAGRERDRLQFVAMVAHDLKNPVLAIEMAGRMLRGSVENEQERRTYLDAISAETGRLRGIVRDLTDDIQVASGHFSICRTKVELCALARRLVRSQANAVSDHELIVHTDGECVVLGDAHRLERVLMNLVSNAVKYSPRNTRVGVRVERNESYALLYVSDEGPGIDEEDLRVIFQPFGRGRSAEASAEGAGMGLYVAKQIIEAHGGRIDVESEPGHGATFRVCLSLA